MSETDPLPRQRAYVRSSAEAAAAVFAVKGWTWSVIDGEAVKPRTPTTEEIERLIWSLIDNLHGKEEGCSSSCGRLFVQVGDEGDAEMSIDLGTLEHFYTEEAKSAAV